MIVGLILAGSIVGAMFGLTTLILGHSVWMALLMYSAVGALSVLAGAAALALRAGSDDQTKPTSSHALAPPQRG
jgi:membrane protein implicated in regulation of membrane protease activity